MPRSCAIAMIDFKSVGRAPLRVVRTNDWSIMMVSNGKRCRLDSDEWPVPKSSSDNPVPSSLIRCSIWAACSGFSITSDSVNSSLSEPRATAERDNTPRTSWIRSWRSNWRDETLTLANSGTRVRVARCQALNCMAVVSITNRPRSTIKPISSVREMNSDGRHPPELGMVAAREGFEARHRAVFQPHDRLVEDGDFLPLDGAAQFGFQRQADGLACAHRRLVDVDAVAADPL